MTAILEDLTAVFHEVFNNDDIKLTPQTTSEDVEGWDSFSHINLIMAIEMKFNIKFTQKEIYTFDNIGELVKSIQAKLSA